MVTPTRAVPYPDQLHVIADIYQKLGGLLIKKYGVSAKTLGDEGGFAPPSTGTCSSAPCSGAGCGREGRQRRAARRARRGARPRHGQMAACSSLHDPTWEQNTVFLKHASAAY
jgi:hypothetical protein